jgi:hypothetical protein
MLQLDIWLWPLVLPSGEIEMMSNVDAAPVAVFTPTSRNGGNLVINGVGSGLEDNPTDIGLSDLSTILNAVEPNWETQLAQSPGA